MTRFQIAGRDVGDGAAPYVIAELSANHNGDLEVALEHIRVAKRCGAAAVKLQTYTADIMTLPLETPDFTISGGLWDGYTLHALYEEAHTPWDWHERLFAEAAKEGITIFSSPFDATAVELLEKLGAPAYKIASFELVDHELIACCAATGKPLIMSTGMANLAEIAAAVRVAREHGAKDLALLHCVSSYPAPAEDANLKTIPHLARAFDVVAGLSDHSPGIALPCAAVALGAAVVEKHFILSRSMGGPDSAFSLEPDELSALVEGCRMAHAASGDVRYELAGSERQNKQFRRSIYFVEDVAEGEEITRKNVRVIRPGHGLAPEFLPQVLGRRAARDITKGTRVAWELLA